MNVKFSLLLVIGLASGSFLTQGAPVFVDTFNSYANGNLAGVTQNAVGQGTWAQNNISATTPVQVAGGKVVLGTSGQDVYAPLTSVITATDGTSFYIGATINLSAAQTGDYFLHFSPTPGDTSAFFARVFARSSGSGFQLGYMETSGTTNAASYGTTDLSFNTDYRVVVAYDFVAGALNDTASIYVNPTSLSIRANNAPYLTDTFWGTATAEPTSIGAINLRQGAATSSASVILDNLAASTVFGDVTAVPEPSTFALVLVGLSSFVLLRRRSSLI